MGGVSIYGGATEGSLTVRHLIHSYLEITAGLRDLGIMRTVLSLQSDYAEWLIADRRGGGRR
jgi:hypothetical protein